MKNLVYGGARVMTGDAIADAVLTYSVALAQHGATDVVDVPTADADGVATTVKILLGPAIAVLAEPAPDDELEPEAGSFVADLARRTHRLGARVHVARHSGRFDGLADAVEDVLDPALDVLDATDRIIDLCVQCTSATEASIVLADGTGALHVVASTSARCSDVEELQVEANEGPTLDSYRTGRTIDAGNLSAEASAWPTVATAITTRGLRGALAEPIRSRTATIGSLSVFTTRDQGYDDRDVALIQLLANTASAALVGQREHHQLRTIDDQVVDAVDARDLFDQATGAIAHRHDIAIDSASRVLRTAARSANRSFRQIANDVISRDDRLDGPT
ncbi:GAF and ANTAR domain-containing protein [Curtobacterium flaccumfaciens pv. flaccumfaciens]|uniref:GAF and ANTAR domain-containing protein n=1 Tax=Curtobacterium flaccumfaciens TaxID=2035 RepID=UPI00217EAD0C|nr:GAF and ANTAR domain-containing protein [Curtobacterium flaccumfaciens]MCS6586945.1 GAF and ANTAR domain-containing protein [Curtobacterium flaccumfaciens pv. flaccumfaciens]